MALEMKKECEKCGRALPVAGEAYICVHECTFCRDCSTSMNSICPNCGGELVRRPRPGKVNRASRTESWFESEDIRWTALPLLGIVDEGMG